MGTNVLKQRLETQKMGQKTKSSQITRLIVHQIFLTHSVKSAPKKKIRGNKW